MWTVSVSVIICWTLKLVWASCPKECWCPSEAQRCAPGVGLVLDLCGCCRVCARQLNEDCSSMEPCDHTKGLECNLGAGYGAEYGICRAKTEGRPCEYDDGIYQNGENFRPNCKHQCTCMDGAVACVSLCPQEVILPKPGCAKPRLLKTPGRCCDQLVCPEGGESWGFQVEEHSREKQSKHDELTDWNELVPLGRGGPKHSPVFRSDPVGQMLFIRRKCEARTTAWSPCSRSCGTGISSRMSNSNRQCKLLRETRICKVRPCIKASFTDLKEVQKCSPVEKSSHPVKLSYAGCGSVKRFRLRFCGSCRDGLCCRPHRTQTVPVHFRCEDGRSFGKNVMMIQSCKCGLSCPNINKPFAAYKHLNAIH